MAQQEHNFAEDSHGNAVFGIPDSKDATFRWTVKRRRFLYHYVRNGGQGANAAEKAGYAAASQESVRLLSHAVMQMAVQEELRTVLTKEGVNSETIIARWVSWADGNAFDYFMKELLTPLIDEHGEAAINPATGRPMMDTNGAFAMTIKDPELLTKEQKSRVKKLTVTNNQYGQNITVELYDAQKALDRLAEVEGLLNKEISSVPPDEAALLIREALAKMEEADGLEDPNATKH